MPLTHSSDLNSVSQPKSVPAAAMPLISPTALLCAHLKQTPPTRPSARSPDQPQQIDLNIGSLTHTNGSAVVKIGSTTVVCGIRAEILPVSEVPSYDPRTNTPRTIADIEIPTCPETHTPISMYNLLVPNLELSTGCSPLHPANTAPSTQAQSLSQRLYSLLLTSHIIPSSDLTITYQPPPEIDIELDPDDPAYVSRETEIKAFWVLYIDMVCISYGGEASVFDAAWLSMYAALQDTVLPKAYWDPDEGMVLCSPDRQDGRKLKIEGMPTPLGYGVVSGREGGVEKEKENWVVVDPDAFEEQCCDEVGCITVDLSEENRAGKILRVEKNGGGVVGVREMKEIYLCAEKRWKEWYAVLNDQRFRTTR